MSQKEIEGARSTDLLHGYEVDEIIHQGPEIIIRRARRLEDSLPVVLKSLRAEHASPREIARLRHEHAIAREIDHPGVVRVLGVEELGGTPALVMEDFGGTSLDLLLLCDKLDLRTTLRVGARVAAALAALHRAGVIHKDVKPHNILVRREPLEVRLTDFGIATRLSHEAPRAENPDVIEGTLAYMSPEQTGWMNRGLDCRTDLYALGISLYQMLTGALPFKATSAMELLRYHLTKTPAPPHVVSPGVPRVLSDIVVKLLSKAAEDRYQHAEALEADLKECLRRHEVDGRIEPFPLGRGDAGGALRIPEKLYGREAETEALVAACERAAAGGVEMLVVSGHAGIGKSTLVHEAYKVLARRPGYFVSGKFNQIKQRAPYAAAAQAFGELCRHLLSEGEESVARWRAQLLAALGSTGQVVLDVVPELERIIGPQPPMTPFGPSESQSRFHLAFQSFVRVVTAERLLVLFIDDMQWADAASIKLLELLLTDPEGKRLLVIGARRDNEVDEAHPLAKLLKDLRAAGASVREVELRPLLLEDVRRLVADALGCSVERAEPFAALTLDKTAGNPFFINQLLRALAESGAVRFDPAAGAWTWDLERARCTEGADDVVELMTARIRRLGPDAQRALRLAACVGHRFDLRTLALADERPPAEVAAALWEALREGLVVPLDPDYRLVHSGDGAALGELLEAPSFRVSYRFLHDRIQQAAYALVEEPERQRTHRRIGRLLLESASREPSDEELFQIVGHLNLGAALIEGPAERSELVRWNLAAGRRAKAAVAFDAAFGYLSAATSVLDPGERALAFDVRTEQAACAYLCGRYEDAAALFTALLDRAASDPERARVYDMWLVLANAQGRFTEGIEVGRRGLRLLGVDMPVEAGAIKAMLDAEVAEVTRNLTRRTLDDIVAGPELTDPDKLAVLKLLSGLLTPTYFLEPVLYPLVSTMMVSLSLRFGNSGLSSFAYGTYGLIIAAILGRPHEGYEIGRIGLALYERYEAVEIKPRVHFQFANIAKFLRPQRESLDHFQRALDAAMAVGDFSYVSLSGNHLAIMKVSLADNLRSAREEIDQYLAFARSIKHAMSTAVQTISRQVIANLEGHTFGRGTLSDARFDEDAFAPTLEAPGLANAACWYYTSKLALACLYEDYEGALRMALEARKWLAGRGGQYFAAVDLPLYTCLTLVALGPRASRDEGGELDAMLASNHDQLAALARGCPEFLHLDLLVRAERASVAGEGIEAALELYDQAIDAAERAGFVRYQALAFERCGRFLARRGKPRIARPYLIEARQAYARWGAAAKVRHIEEAYGALLPRATARSPASVLLDASSIATSITLTATRRAALLDAAAVIRSAQAVAREVSLDRVVAQLLQLTVENAGAQRGALVLSRDDGLRVEAVAEEGDEVRVGPPAPLRESNAVAASVIELVAREKGAVIVVDAAADARLEGDPYVAARRPRSMLALPMVSQGRLTGILYLENNAASDVFSPARLNLLELIASQAAVAIENALLYGRVEEASGELRRANDALEATVAARTAELSAAKARLELELAERARAEQARAELQGDLIHMQRQRLAELSTPLIPITDRIMVMPLIGTMDAERAQQAIETALRGVSETGAGVVILDITGVALVDSSVASALVQAATALRLLGAEVVITGIRPEVARMLIGLGVDLSALVTQGALSRGIAYALQKTREVA